MSAFDIVTENYFDDETTKSKSIPYTVVSEDYFDNNKHIYYVIVTDEAYGGKDKIKIINSKREAKQYIENSSDKLRKIMIMSDSSLSGDVYVTVTEEQYGGGKNKVGLFENKKIAEMYARHISKNGNFNVLIIEKHL